MCVGIKTGKSAPDAVYQHKASESGDVTFTLDAAFGAVQSVRPDYDGGCYGGASEPAVSGTFTVTVSLDAGAKVFVVVDGHASDAIPDAGPFTLTVSKPPT